MLRHQGETLLPDSGTSMACPVAAGVAALYMSVYGKQGPDAMDRVLKNAVGSISYERINEGDYSNRVVMELSLY